MNELPFHPSVVHLPLALGVLMPLLALGLLLAWKSQWLPPRAWVIALLLQGLLVGTGFVALSTGEREEERVAAVVSEPKIEHHEAAAQLFVGASAGVWGLMALAWVLSSRRLGLPMACAATFGTLVVLVLAVRAGRAGGELVYRHGAASAYTRATPASPVGQDGAPAAGDDD